MTSEEQIKERIRIFEDEALLSMKETANYLGIHVDTLYYWRKNNKIKPPMRLRNGYTVRYKLLDIKEFLNGT